jgi:hypothetical protein
MRAPANMPIRGAHSLAVSAGPKSPAKLTLNWIPAWPILCWQNSEEGVSPGQAFVFYGRDVMTEWLGGRLVKSASAK